MLGPGKLALLEPELVTLTLLLASFFSFPTFSVVSKPEFDDWSLVLTTSRGQVTIAPVVPPTLKNLDIKDEFKMVQNFPRK